MIGLNGEAALLLAHPLSVLAQNRLDGQLTTFAGMEAGENGKLRSCSVLARREADNVNWSIAPTGFVQRARRFYVISEDPFGWLA